MASVATLANNEPCNVSYTSEEFWVEAGTSITVQVSYSGTGSSPTSRTLEGSLDGVIWNLLLDIGVGDGNGIRDYHGIHNVNYVRFKHNGNGSGSKFILVKMIQPNFQKVDVNSLPA